MASLRSSRLAHAWADVRDSLWFLPAVGVLAGTALALLAVLVPTPRTDNRLALLWLFGGGAEGARGMLTAIAGSLITVTGTVFSVTIVALQLASSQFTPRLLRSFVADRVNQVVLGVFIGTFTYTLLVLRTIRSASADGDRGAFVPQVAVTLALVLLLVSIAALIVFINHAARSIQASVILHRVAVRTVARIEERFPARVGEPAGDATDGDAPGVDDATLPDGEPGVVAAEHAGYLQSVHAERLWALGGDGAAGRITIGMAMHVGDFVFPGMPLASVWPAARAADDGVVCAVREAFVLGSERTPEQDVEFGIVELSDIALRALSPGINDPTTAMHCIDRLAEVVAALDARCRPEPQRVSPDHVVRLLVRDTSFARAAALAFDQLRHVGADNPAIARKLLETLGHLAGVVGRAERRVLAGHVEAVARAARRATDDVGELAATERFAARATAAAARGGA